MIIQFNNTVSMKALHIVKYGRFPVLKQLPIPELNDSDFLIKMKYAPINPSDINFYQGKYGIKKQGFPIVGFEGSGIIQKAKDQSLIGKKVIVMANKTNGTHATYIKSSIDEVIVIPQNINLQQASMGFVNPFSCVGLCQIVAQQKPDNVLISAAASQIGRMLVSTLRKRYPSLKIYGLNRSMNKSQILRQLGITQTLLIQDPSNEKLRQLKGKTVFLDSVGGPFAGKTLNILGPESQLVCYGKQSGQDLASVNMGELYYNNKTIRGFWLNNWMRAASKQQLQNAKKQVVINFNQFYKSSIRKTFKIQDFMQAYRASITDKSQGKILLDLS